MIERSINMVTGTLKLTLDGPSDAVEEVTDKWKDFVGKPPWSTQPEISLNCIMADQEFEVRLSGPSHDLVSNLLNSLENFLLHMGPVALIKDDRVRIKAQSMFVPDEEDN
jgi:hypothetical protein